MSSQSYKTFLKEILFIEHESEFNERVWHLLLELLEIILSKEQLEKLLKVYSKRDSTDRHEKRRIVVELSNEFYSSGYIDDILQLLETNDFDEEDWSDIIVARDEENSITQRKIEILSDLGYEYQPTEGHLFSYDFLLLGQFPVKVWPFSEVPLKVESLQQWLIGAERSGFETLIIIGEGNLLNHLLSQDLTGFIDFHIVPYSEIAFHSLEEIERF